jgi:hypothetical protein
LLVAADVQPKCGNQVKYNGRTQGEAGGIDKIQAYSARGYTQLISQGFANPKSALFDGIFYPAHGSKIAIKQNTVKHYGTIRRSVFRLYI